MPNGEEYDAEFTVILLRPERLSVHTETDYGQDVYVALIKARGSTSAVVVAQEELAAADKADGLPHVRPSDYKLCLVFAGHHEATLYGWQIS